MKRRLLRASAIALAVLALAAACPAKEPPAPHEMTPEEMIAACGEGCTVVGFIFDLQDEDLYPVPQMDGISAEFTLEAWEIDATIGIPKFKEVLDADQGVMVPTPYTFSDVVPLTSLHGIPDGVVQVIMTATVFVPAGWTFSCKTVQKGLSFEHPIFTDSKTAPIDPGAEGAMGLPVDLTIHCSWPIDDLTDIT